MIIKRDNYHLGGELGVGTASEGQLQCQELSFVCSTRINRGLKKLLPLTKNTLSDLGIDDDE